MVLIVMWAAGVALPGGVAQAEEPAVEVRGRLFVREAVVSLDGGDWFGEAEVASARVTVAWQRAWARAALELEGKSGKAELKDAWLRLDLPSTLALRAGQFKLPVSALELESPFDQAAGERGMLSDLLRGSLRAAGRRPGLQLEWRGGGARARLGAFQSVGVLDEPAPGLAEDGLGLDMAARGAWHGDVAGGVELTVGGSGIWRLMTPDLAGATPERHWLLGVDATLERRWCFGALRVWAEGFIGTSSFDTTPATPEAPLLVAGRLQLAWRWGGTKRDTWYVEPYLQVGALDVNLDNADDLVFETELGVNAGLWRRWRAGVELSLWRESALTPIGFAAGDVDLTDRDAVFVHVQTEM
jgi:hypothetical protein